MDILENDANDETNETDFRRVSLRTLLLTLWSGLFESSHQH